MMNTHNQTSSGALHARRWWALIALAFCLLVISLDQTILNVALPSLARDLHATESQLQWMVDGYTLIYASLVLLGGSFADRFGRKRILLLGLLLFGGGSLWSALSSSAVMLIIARGFMGIGGALIMPATLALVATMFTGAERSTAIGILQGIGGGVGLAIGPLIGGVLLDHFTWPVLFLINVPVILLALPFCLWLVPESRVPNDAPLDVVGGALSITGMFALLFGIIEASTYALTEPRIVAALIAASVLLTGFVLWERHSSAPMLDMNLFRNPTISACVLALTLASLGMAGAMFFLTQYLQLVLDLSPLAAGSVFLPLVIGVLLTSIGVSPYLQRRIGAKHTVAAGLFVAAASIGLFATLSVSTSFLVVVGLFFLLGAGVGITNVPATDAIIGSLPADQVGVGAAAADTAPEVGGVLGVAVLGSILTAAYHSAIDHAPLVQSLPAPTRAIIRDSLGSAVAVAPQLGSQAERIIHAAQAAFVVAIGPAALIGAAIAASGALVALLFMPSRVAMHASDGDATVAETEPLSVL